MGQEHKKFSITLARYIDAQLKKLAEHMSCLRSAGKDKIPKDSEHIHQARVASRRLRASLDLFESVYKDGKVKKWKKDIKGLTKGLGQARDLDVQMEFISKVIKESGSENKKVRPGLKRILLRLKQSRLEVNPCVMKSLARIEKKNTLPSIGAAASGIIWQERLFDSSEPKRDDLHIPKVELKEKIQRFVLHEDCLSDPNAKRRHHKMRIAAKKLRYSMEICEPVFEDGLELPIKAAKKVQSLAGKVHDFDVWLDKIDEFSDQEHKRTIKYYGFDRQMWRFRPGFEYLKNYCRRLREEKFDKLVEYWGQVVEAKIWPNMLDLLNSSLKDAAVREVSEVSRDEEVKTAEGKDQEAERNSGAFDAQSSN